MKIAIDFDDTITLNLDKWKEVISFFMNKMGADVRIVTFRCEGLPGKSNPDIDAFVESFWSDLQVIYTGGRQKAHVCAELGWNPDVWIDDNPSTIASYDAMKGMVKGCEVNRDTGGVIKGEFKTPKPSYPDKKWWEQVSKDSIYRLPTQHPPFGIQSPWKVGDFPSSPPLTSTWCTGGGLVYGGL